MEKQRAKKEKVRLQRDAAAAPLSASPLGEQQDNPIPVRFYGSKKDRNTQVNEAEAQSKGRAAPARETRAPSLPQVAITAV